MKRKKAGKKAKQSSAMVPFEVIYQAWEDEMAEEKAAEAAKAATAKPAGKAYRNAALEKYVRKIGDSTLHVCVVCGFGIKEILEVAHLSQDRSDNDLQNLAVLCPNCHKMHDIGLIPTDVVRALRDHKPELNWKLRIKDAGAKAAAKRKEKAGAAKRSASAKKAVAARALKAGKAGVGSHA